jgi:hypothetical protein
VSEFVDECRREWRRLGVPDPVANEMAADLTADLEEAEAEGGSPEDVLGNSAFDPRRFAAAWAVARGVTGPPVPDRPRLWRPSVAFALTAFLGLITVGAGLVLLVGTRGHSFAVAVHRVVMSPGSMKFFAPGPGRLVAPGPPFAATQLAGVDFRPLALVLLLVGLAGLGLLAVLYWARRSGHRRDHQDGGRQTPSWS